MNVVVYSGPGTSGSAVRHTLKTLNGLLGGSYDVISVSDPKVLARGLWKDSTALLVMPGGRDVPYVRSLSPEGIAIIRSYVQDGGKYLGLCAGAYFGCASIDFSTHSHVKFPSLSKIPGSEEGEHSHIYGPRDLRFFPGMALGSITPDFTYNSEKGAHAITLELDSNLLGLKDVSRPNVYVNGGPYFVQIAPDDCVKTLAWYSGGSDAKKAAIVECSVGLGKAILCGPHVEYDAVELDNDAKSVIASEETRCCLSRIIPALMVSNAARGILMKKLVERLGLSVDTALEEKARFSVSETPIYAIPLTQSAAITSDKLVKAGPTKDTHGSWVARLVDRDHTFQSMEENTLDLVICESPNALLPLTSFDIPKFALKWTELYASLAESQMGSYLLFKKPFGSYLMYADVASSTQTILEKNYKLSQILDEGTVFVASQQTAGRGRGKNSWISQEGCLMLSLLIHHRAPSTLVFIQYIFAMAVCHAVKSVCAKQDFPVFIKWPNDIYTRKDGKLQKIGGILVTSSYDGGIFKVVVGCGLNVENSKPTVSLRQIAQAFGVDPGCMTRESLLASILTHFELLYRIFEAEESFSSLLDGYLANWLHSDQRVTVSQDGRAETTVILTGIDLETGYLKAITDDANREEIRLQPDGNSFDMMKGLIHQKQ